MDIRYPAEAADRPRILVVEPNKAYLGLLVRRLVEAGYRVTAAESVPAAIAELHRLPVDMILAELRMPRISGVELARAIRGEVQWNDIPIMLITGKSKPAEAVHAYEAGADDVIAKPFHFEVLFARIDRRIATGYCDQRTDSIDEAIATWLEAREARRPLALALCANAADVLPAILARGIVPDIVTDQTFPDPVRGYVPSQLSLEETRAMRKSDPACVATLARDSIAAHVRALLAFQKKGAIVFEYGNGLRAEARSAGVDNAFDIGSFVDLYIRPLFCEGMGPFRWIAVSGDPKDIHTIDDIILKNFSQNHPIVPWIEKARKYVQFTGLPARIGWLGYGERSRLGLLVNEAIADGRISAPIAFTRDHLDSGSAAMPHRETENMRDGSYAIADWPMLNALLNCASGADLVAIHGLGSRGVSAGVTIVADGTASAAERLKRVLDNDPGIGVLRHADAGYETAIEQAGKIGYAPAVGLEEQHTT